MKTSIKFIVLITITLLIFTSCTQNQDDGYEHYKTEKKATDPTNNDQPSDPETQEDEPELDPNAAVNKVHKFK